MHINLPAIPVAQRQSCLRASHIFKNINVKRRQAVSALCRLEYHQFDFLKVSFTQLYLTSRLPHQLIHQGQASLSGRGPSVQPGLPLVNRASAGSLCGSATSWSENVTSSWTAHRATGAGGPRRGEGNILLSVPMARCAVAKTPTSHCLNMNLWESI